jgi:hypothetical protein
MAELQNTYDRGARDDQSQHSRSELVIDTVLDELDDDIRRVSAAEHLGPASILVPIPGERGEHRRPAGCDQPWGILRACAIG